MVSLAGRHKAIAISWEQRNAMRYIPNMADGDVASGAVFGSGADKPTVAGFELGTLQGNAKATRTG